MGNKEKKQMRTNNAIIEFALLITGTMIVLQFLKPIIEGKGLFFEFFTLIIFGLGGIGMGIIFVGLYVWAIGEMERRKQQLLKETGGMK